MCIFLASDQKLVSVKPEQEQSCQADEHSVCSEAVGCLGNGNVLLRDFASFCEVPYTPDSKYRAYLWIFIRNAFKKSSDRVKKKKIRRNIYDK